MGKGRQARTARQAVRQMSKRQRREAAANPPEETFDIPDDLQLVMRLETAQDRLKKAVSALLEVQAGIEDTILDYEEQIDRLEKRIDDIVDANIAEQESEGCVGSR